MKLCLPLAATCRSLICVPRAHPFATAASSGVGLGLPRVAELIGSATPGSVVVMAGAGVSVSSGIPDFRSPGTGLYDNLQEYGLPYPEAIFDLDFYRRNPKPFQRLCKELWPGNFAPSPTHYFFKLLHDKGKLRRVFTQNIDSLETASGLPADLVVAAHGNFDGAHRVTDTGHPGAAVPLEEVRQAALHGGDAEWDALFEAHGGPVKPSIVFFGEQLPRRFFELARADFPKCELLLVLGTSLGVHPFAGLVGETRVGVPRLLINRDRVGEHLGLDFASGTDGWVGGDSDAAVRELASLLGWTAELEQLV
ncbi:NAD-dependent deacetylase SIRT2, partial [Emiliania huxleyi CCMP1516]|uniref:Deacetylase sirtuin-type domain-containing protein n=2 Tax=Emiliania huxleyi TaxID=2903 RepID=A0A0D3J2V5_EMIH1